MKRPLLLALPALAAGYAYWVSTPKLRNVEYIEQLSEEAREHLLECQRKAHSRETNGWTSPLFEGLWHSSSDSPIFLSKVLRSWGHRASIFPDRGEFEDSLELDSEEARTEFSRQLPIIHEELNKEVFLPTDISYNASSLDLDFLTQRALAYALAAESESLWAEGRQTEAMECLRSILALSKGYRAFSLMVRLIFSCSFLNVACQTILHVHSPDDEEAPWSELSIAILDALPSWDDLVLALKCEFGFGCEFFESIRRGELPIDRLAEIDEKLPLWKRLPGQLGRQRRIFQRDHSEFVRRMEGGLSTRDLTNELGEKFNRYLSRTQARIQFCQTVALVCRYLAEQQTGRDGPGRAVEIQGLPNSAEYRDGRVVFEIVHEDLEIDIVSSAWVENQGRKIVFNLVGDL